MAVEGRGGEEAEMKKGRESGLVIKAIKLNLRCFQNIVGTQND